MARVVIQALLIDPATQMPAVMLNVLGRGSVFPLYVGLFEANSILLEMEGIETPRPMTHDLLKNVIKAMGGVVDRVALTDLREHTFFATVYIRCGDDELTLDSRPSDAFALALRWRAPIFVDDDVLERVQVFPSVETWQESCNQQFEAILKRATDPE